MLGSPEGPEEAVDDVGVEPASDESGCADGETRGALVDGAGDGAGAGDGKPNISSGNSTASIANMLHGAAL